MHKISLSMTHAGAKVPALSLDRTLPQHWSELTPAQAWRCINAYMTNKPPRQIVKDLLKVPTSVFSHIGTGEMYDLIQLLSWMEMDNISTAPVAPYIDVKLSRFRHERLFLPSDKFNNVVGLEYSLVDEEYGNLMEDRSEKAECKMIAYILRPEGESPDPTSDPRVQLRSPDHISQWIHIVEALPISLRTYFTFFINANRRFIADMYGPWLFKSAPAPGEDGSHAQDSDDDGLDFGWHGAFLDVASDGLLGDYEKVLQTPIHTICIHMVRKVEEALRLQREHAHRSARES